MEYENQIGRCRLQLAAFNAHIDGRSAALVNVQTSRARKLRGLPFEIIQLHREPNSQLTVIDPRLGEDCPLCDDR